MSAGNGELISLADCQPENLMWVSGWYDAAHKKKTGWHLYQFGAEFESGWGNAWPAVMPACRAPGYQRSAHDFWFEYSRHYDDWPERLCHKCIVEILMKFPEIFQR